MRKALISFAVLAIVCALPCAQFLSGCKPVSGFEEQYDISVYGYITEFNVPDSSSQNDIRVRLKGTIGESTAYSFDRIGVARTDSLFRIGVVGRETYKTGVVYQPKNNDFDTTVVLMTPRRGMHYIDILAAQGTFSDSTYVY